MKIFDSFLDTIGSARLRAMIFESFSRALEPSRLALDLSKWVGGVDVNRAA